ncbi:MAG: nucleotidyltransferase family protein [Candidatus Aureabacteria bacterium]|nr:nucleotidyltransferase family protein [Candidatus Auribacterota bacterium]
MKTASFIHLLANDIIQWPPSWKEEDWEDYTQLCQHAQLTPLLYFRLREAHDGCPSAIMERLKNQFDLTFSHAARFRTETERLSGKIRSAGMRLCFLKGYPLSLTCYPHMACRIMQDIDCYAEPRELEKMKPFFKEAGYTLLRAQSGLEHKWTFVKLHGPHVYSFEFHRSLYTSYQNKQSPLPEHAFDREGFPSPEVLFLSVLLHHRYYECSIRDLLDLQMILLKHPSIDWKIIEAFCRREKLSSHLILMSKLSSVFFHTPWPLPAESAGSLPAIRKVIHDKLYGLRSSHALWRPKERGWLAKIADAILVFFVYDDWITGFNCFWNKYIRFVDWKKYLRLFS